MCLWAMIFCLLSSTNTKKYISNDAVKDVYETVFVDIVNMVGVGINEALRDPYASQLLQYVAGLGPRKASGLLRNITAKLGTLVTRSDLIENELSTANIFFNCSSFLNIPFDEGTTVRDSSIELLDATRIHPEDYSLARKMAADALDLDEEDMAHIEEQGGIIYQLMQEGVSKVDDLNLTAFGKELESTFGKKKYATLQSIKEELVNNYEELRRSFHLLENSEVFRMLTGETLESFTRGSITPVTINRVGKNYREDNGHVKFLRVSTTSNISGTVEEGHIVRNSNFDQGQVIQVVVLDVNYEQFTATSARSLKIFKNRRSRSFSRILASGTLLLKMLTRKRKGQKSMLRWQRLEMCNIHCFTISTTNKQRSIWLLNLLVTVSLDLLRGASTISLSLGKLPITCFSI